MQIKFDFDSPPGAPVSIYHWIDTEPGKDTVVSHPLLGVNPVDKIHYILALKTGVIPIAGTGWDEITKHSLYPGQTRLQALIGEIVRLNDTASRTILGV